MSSTVFASRMQEIIVINLFTAFFILFSQNSHSQEKFPTGELTVKTQDTSYDFDIELALDDSHRQYGLMFRTNLPEMNGMLFIYEEKKRISMWMKNTFIPLDILFIDDDGKIIRIAKSQQPRSLSLIRSGGEAKAVLELYGGLTDKLNIAVGDEIIYPTFGNMKK
ncbi:DUF192 domain-containing protein [Emcibacteraceae bacterium]|nr:DUF192 domain-containing protein [Emcibacteraceae bacterium]MDA9771035.1 DUF192 domain-containing protein [Emcibacteraceae bacterium]MDC1090055.1 DUF192 domain-containing protein [Emcibacteraceae bacterium]